MNAATPTAEKPPERARRRPISAEPVPLGIWLCAPTSADESGLPPLAEGLSRSLVSRVAREYSEPGDMVLCSGLDAQRVAAVMAAATGNKSAEPGSRIVTPSHQGDGTDRDLGLIFAIELPVPIVGDDGQPYQTWARLLRPGGVLAVLVANPAGAGRFAHHAATVARAARQAGLTYLQHIVAVLAHVEGDRLLIPDPPHGRPDDEAVTVPVHSDLLIFHKPIGGRS